MRSPPAGRDGDGVDLLALVPAHRKDGGVEPATLAFVLSEVKVQRVPADLTTAVTVEELQATTCATASPGWPVQATGQPKQPLS